MPFPEYSRVIYAKHALTEVVCQLRFPPILRIGEGQLAEFQDRLRETYPLYSQQQPTLQLPEAARELSALVQQMGFPAQAGLVTHRLATKDSLRFVALAQDFLALSDLSYTRWEQFTEELHTAEKALVDVYKPAFYTRVGLRYKDLIRRSVLGLEGVPWSELLQPHIVAELGAQEVADSVQSLRTNAVFRLQEVEGGFARVVHGLAADDADGEKGYVIDADLWLEKKEGVDDPFGVLDRFNRLAGRLFRWAITDRLHGAMGPRNP